MILNKGALSDDFIFGILPYLQFGPPIV